MSLKIRFFSEDIAYSLKEKVKIRQWIADVIVEESKHPGPINYIFCSDTYLLTLNESYLGHDTLTDIITFPYTDDNKAISGDIFISLDRVKENAVKFKVDFSYELLRVMVHGVLHLLGYKDKSTREKAIMRAKENYYIEKFGHNVSRGT